MYFTGHLPQVMSRDQAIKITVQTNVRYWPPLHQKTNSAFRSELNLNKRGREEAAFHKQSNGLAGMWFWF